MKTRSSIYLESIKILLGVIIASESHISLHFAYKTNHFHVTDHSETTQKAAIIIHTSVV